MYRLILFFLYSASIKEDLSNWEKGTMWPLSCYSPAPSGVCPNLTNMEDHSMEEIRYLAYEAQANGTSQQYVRERERGEGERGERERGGEREREEGGRRSNACTCRCK